MSDLYTRQVNGAGPGAGDMKLARGVVTQVTPTLKVAIQGGEIESPPSLVAASSLAIDNVVAIATTGDQILILGRPGGIAGTGGGATGIYVYEQPSTPAEPTDVGDLWIDTDAPANPLSNGASGQIIVCNASGVPTYQTPTGSINLTNAGAFSQQNQYDEDSGVGINTGGSWSNVCNFTISEAGTYLIVGKVVVYINGTYAQSTQMRLLLGLGTVLDTTSNSGQQFDRATSSLHCLKRVALAAGDVITLQAGTLQSGGSASANDARLFAMRLS